MKRFGGLLGWSFVAVTAGAAPAEMDLSAWRERVKQNSAEIQALELEGAASLSQIEEAENMALSPFLFLDAGQLDSQKPNAMPAQMGTQTVNRNVGFGLAKQFSTGTAAKIVWKQEYQNINGMSFPYSAGWTSSLGVELQQSLWKNAFGRQTRRSFERQDRAAEMSKIATELTRQGKWAAAESAYWDWVQKSTFVEVRKEDLKRAEELRYWMRDQVQRGLSTPSESMQVEALVVLRRMEIQAAEDDVKKSVEEMRLFDASFDPSSVVIPSEDHWRKVQSDRIGAESKVSLSARLAELQSAVTELKSEESADDLGTDLTLQGAYYGHKRDAEFSKSALPSFSQDKDTLSLALSLKLNLDRGAVSKLHASFAAQAKAAKLRAEKAKEDGTRSWKELVRGYEELKKKSALAEELTDVQTRKAQREKGLFQKGRSNTFQLVTFERERSEARLQSLQMLIGLRKTEAQALLYAPLANGGS